MTLWCPCMDIGSNISHYTSRMNIASNIGCGIILSHDIRCINIGSNISRRISSLSISSWKSEMLNVEEIPDEYGVVMGTADYLKLIKLQSEDASCVFHESLYAQIMRRRTLIQGCL